jgi:hypothetical protein
MRQHGFESRWGRHSFSGIYSPILDKARRFGNILVKQPVRNRIQTPYSISQELLGKVLVSRL